MLVLAPVPELSARNEKSPRPSAPEKSNEEELKELEDQIIADMPPSR